MLKRLEDTLTAAVFMIFIFVYLFEFTGKGIFADVRNVLIVFLVYAGVFFLRGTALFVSIFALTVGNFLWFYYGMDFGVWMDGMNKNLPLVIIFVAAPLLSMPLNLGGYLKAVHNFLEEYVGKGKSLFPVLSGFVFFLGSITNLGFIRITDDLLKPAGLPDKFLARVYASGFASCIAWSPYFAAVNLSILYGGMSFGEYLPYGLGYALVLFLAGNVFFKLGPLGREKIRVEAHPCGESEGTVRKILAILLAIVIILVLVLAGERAFEFSSTMALVGLVALVVSAGWIIILRPDMENCVSELSKYAAAVSGVRKEAVFFLSAGFMGVILARTPIKYFMEDVFSRLTQLPTAVSVGLVILFITAFSVIGVHQVVSATIIGLTVSPEILGLAAPAYVMMLLAGWITAMVVSPLAPFNIIASGLLHRSPFELGLKINFGLGVVTLLVSSLWISLVNGLIM